MTNEKIQAVLTFYEAKLKELLAEDSSPRMTHLIHAQTMLPSVHGYLRENRRGKVFRWLGFMQGIFYCHGIYTIREMADHNRTSKKDFREFNPEHHFQDDEPCRACRDWDGCCLAADFAGAPDE